MFSLVTYSLPLSPIHMSKPAKATNASCPTSKISLICSFLILFSKVNRFSFAWRLRFKVNDVNDIIQIRITDELKKRIYQVCGRMWFKNFNLNFLWRLCTQRRHFLSFWKSAFPEKSLSNVLIGGNLAEYWLKRKLLSRNERMIKFEIHSEKANLKCYLPQNIGSGFKLTIIH